MHTAMLLMYRLKTARRSMARETSRIGANNGGWLHQRSKRISAFCRRTSYQGAVLVHECCMREEFEQRAPAPAVLADALAQRVTIDQPIKKSML